MRIVLIHLRLDAAARKNARICVLLTTNTPGLSQNSSFVCTIRDISRIWKVGGCKIKVSSRSEIFFSAPPQMGCKHHPMGGDTPVFDIDLKNPGIALQANSLRGDVCAL